MVWVTLLGTFGECLTQPPYNLTANMVYGTDADHRDIEFSITGLNSLTGLPRVPLPPMPAPCSPRVRAFADSDFDMSPECDLNFGIITFECPCNADISCEKTARVQGGPETDVLQLCDLPAEVTYKLSATNDGDCVPCAVGTLQDECQSTATVKFPRHVTPGVMCEIEPSEELPICTFPTTVVYTVKVTNTGDVAANLSVGGDLCADSWSCVAPGETRQCELDITYDETYCGGEDFTNTMSGTATGDGDCVCPADPVTCQDSATVGFPPYLDSSFTCEKTVDGQSEVYYDNVYLPATLTYVMKSCNTGETNLDITIEDLDGHPLGGDWQIPPEAEVVADGKWLFRDVAPGECTPDIVYTVMVQRAEPCIFREWENSMEVTAVLSPTQPDCGCPLPPPAVEPCSATVTIHCSDGDCQEIYQVYPGDTSGNLTHFMGKLAGSGDPITAVPGVLSIVPGENRSNYVLASGA